LFVQDEGHRSWYQSKAVHGFLLLARLV